eukprot:CAMPEP_0185331116 /NCGR_PEP_ID=MMETSP1363-20130426/78586_1 /TAXON_ID=38817 /ORGANISM="Gephyrocapsa oceanica, Strain RCC1303" /LENGTH=116 /DNA_ID=CAMNT_0027929983 /DNA_START=172 /DNA_END=519 /DNA_ORIENTATION=+
MTRPHCAQQSTRSQRVLGPLQFYTSKICTPTAPLPPEPTSWPVRTSFGESEDWRRLPPCPRLRQARWKSAVEAATKAAPTKKPTPAAEARPPTSYSSEKRSPGGGGSRGGGGSGGG